MDKQQRSRQAKFNTVVGAIINVILGVTKVVFGFLGHSQALIADGVHSISDLLTDALVFIASHYGSQDADPEHPYGHGRIETAATLFLAMLVILAGAGIAYDAVNHLFQGHFERPDVYVLFIAGISVLAKEALYHYTKHTGQRINSELLIANAWHHRSDAASSIVVLLGVAGSLMGFYYLDAMAAIVIGLMVIKMGWGVGWHSVRELVDTGVAPELLMQIKQIIKVVPGVREIHQLRTRSLGGHVFVDVHVLVAPSLSVSEGHHIGQQVHFNLVKKLKTISDVTVHIDPEDDEVAPPSLHLPTREDVLPQLEQRWAGLYGVDSIRDIHLHYLKGRLQLEVVLPAALLDDYDPLTLVGEYKAAIVDLPQIELKRLLFA